MSYEPTVWVDGDHVTSAKLNKLEQGVNSMSYTPTVWNAGDVVTAEKLNKLEQGVAEGGGGGGGASVPIFVAHQDMTVTCETSYSDFVSILKSAGLKDTSEVNIYPCVMDMHEVDGADSVLTANLTKGDIINADMGNGYFIAYDGEGIRVEEK